MIPVPDVAQLLRDWLDSERRLRVIALAGPVQLTAYCKVYEVNEDSFSVAIGFDARNTAHFRFEGYVFDLKDVPPNSADPSGGGEFESVIKGIRSGLTLDIYLLRDEP